MGLVSCGLWQLGGRSTYHLHRLAQDDNNVLLGQDLRPVEEEVCRRDVGQRHSLDKRIRRNSEAHVDLYLSNCLLEYQELVLEGLSKIIVP
jgi:hypothetical protein